MQKKQHVRPAACVRLRTEMFRRNITLEVIAKRLRVTPEAISMTLRGERKRLLPSIQKAVQKMGGQS